MVREIKRKHILFLADMVPYRRHCVEGCWSHLFGNFYNWDDLLSFKYRFPQLVSLFFRHLLTKISAVEHIFGAFFYQMSLLHV